MEMDKEKIRPIYLRLQGYLSQTPKAEANFSSFKEPEMWNQVNKAIEELNNILDKSYDDFKIESKTRLSNKVPQSYVNVIMYRTKLGGLINQLHGEFFSNEQAPFSGVPSTVNIQNQQQTQQQSQEVRVQMILEFQSEIDEKIQKLPPGSNERTFLEKIKKSLSKVSNYTQLVQLLLTTGEQMDLTIKQILNLLS